MNKLPMLNRELSWLDYNARVLAEGLKPSTPLLEKLNFMRIFASNLDEFFMVRVAAVKSALLNKQTSEEWAGMHPRDLLDAIHQKVQQQYDTLYAHLHEIVLPGLAANAIHLLSQDAWSSREWRYLERFFAEKVYPLLTPLRLEPDIFPPLAAFRCMLHSASKGNSRSQSCRCPKILIDLSFCLRI
jgi:polyphosphate kinase